MRATAIEAGTSMHNPVTAPPRARRIDSVAEGAQLIAELDAVLDALLKVVEDETAFVREGRVTDASRLEPKKTELASRYYSATERLKGNAEFLRANLAGELDALQRRHEMFRALLQINLAVLATAHAVSEGIIRGVAGEVTRKAAPSTYGASGRSTAPAPSAARPVALSRTL